MSSHTARLRAELAAAGLAPLHRLGQNFMVDEAALATMASTLDLAPGMRVIEIGPGTGLLTERWLAAGATVLAVELDRGLHGLLAARFATEPRIHLVHGDALASKSRLHPEIEAFAAAGPWRLGANLPYDISLPALLDAVALPRPPERVAVTIQREAAERLCAAPGADAWGATAAVLQAAGVPRLVRRLGPGSFYPPPRVDSAILAWEPRAPLPAGYPAWCRSLFAYRRKVLPRALRDTGLSTEAAGTALATAKLDPTRRVEQLAAAELLALFAALPVT